MIGERLLELRKDAGLTQDELASVLSINKHSVSSYERDKSEPPDTIKIEIAKYFNVSVDYLLGVTDNPNPQTNNNNLLRLPVRFPQEAMNDLYTYVDYLMYKHNQANNN